MSVSKKLTTIAENIPRVFQAGEHKGFDTGYHDGYELGLNNGFEDGYTEGVDDGYTAGATDAWGNGYTEGYDKGKTDGYNDGTSEGYKNGHSDGVTEGFASGKEQGITEGKQAEYDRFWDLYQENGNRTNYVVAFARNGWTDETFKPKYDIKPVGDTCNQTFAFSYMTNIAQSLREQGVVLDTSEAAYFQQMFQGCKTTEIPTIDLSKATTTGYVFQQCTSLVKIEKIILSETTPTPSTMFSACYALKDITFEGVIASSINFNYSPLSVDSMKSIISCLKNYLGTSKQDTQTVKFTSDCWAALEASSTAPHGGTWIDYVNYQLGWLT